MQPHPYTWNWLGRCNPSLPDGEQWHCVWVVVANVQYWPWKKLIIVVMLTKWEISIMCFDNCESTEVCSYRCVKTAWKNRVPCVIERLSCFSQEMLHQQGRLVQETKQSLFMWFMQQGSKGVPASGPLLLEKVLQFSNNSSKFVPRIFLKLAVDALPLLHLTFQSYRQFQNSGHPLVPHWLNKWDSTVLQQFYHN